VGVADAEQPAVDRRQLVRGRVDDGDVARLDGSRECDGHDDEEGGNDEPRHGIGCALAFLFGRPRWLFFMDEGGGAAKKQRQTEATRMLQVHGSGLELPLVI
jgi:hypothetical protein